jgi:hypothetical protein
MPPHDNRHPADLLADVRAQKRELELREKELRDYLVAHGDDRVGGEFLAEVESYEYAYVRAKEAVRRFGRAALRGLLVEKDAQRIWLHKIGPDGEW